MRALERERVALVALLSVALALELEEIDCETLHEGAGSGDGKVTPLELFADGILDLEPKIRELIRAAA